MKLGLDFHGVIDKEAPTFSVLTKLLVENGHEVHEENTPSLRNKLEAIGIRYTHLFSISSHHRSIGTKMWRDGKDTPWMDQQTWDVTKAEYCKKNKIDLHIDDSEIYGKWFRTPYLLFTKERAYG